MLARATSMAASTVAVVWRTPVATTVGADEHPVAVDGDRRPLVDRLHHLGADVVDQGDAGLAEQQRPEVRVAAGDRGGGVDHRHRGGVDQRLGRHPVEVLVVDHRDVAGLQALDQPLGAPVDPGDAGDRPVRVGAASRTAPTAAAVDAVTWSAPGRLGRRDADRRPSGRRHGRAVVGSVVRRGGSPAGVATQRPLLAGRGRQQLGGVGAGGVAVGLARQHARQLDDPLVVVEHGRPATRSRRRRSAWPPAPGRRRRPPPGAGG